MGTNKTVDRRKKSSDSEISLEILGFQSINPSFQECLEMDTCFLEEQVARYSNAHKYAIPSAAICLVALNFKIRKIRDIKLQGRRIWSSTQFFLTH